MFVLIRNMCVPELDGCNGSIFVRSLAARLGVRVIGETERVFCDAMFCRVGFMTLTFKYGKDCG